MLLKFSNPDMLNTELIDAQSGRRLYTVLSRALYIQGKDKSIVDVASRTSTITDSHGKVVAVIEWTGNEKRTAGLITICGGQPVKFVELFDGCDTVQALPDQLVVPSRLGYTWVATRNALLVRRSDSEQIVGKYWERCVQVGNTISPSPLPGVGKDFLEFSSLPEEVIVELIVDFIFMNIMRRTRFDLPKYEFSLLEDSDMVKSSVVDLLRHVGGSVKRRASTSIRGAAAHLRAPKPNRVSCST